MIKLAFIILCLASTANAQFPWNGTDWISANTPNNGVAIGAYAGSATPNIDAVRIGFFAGAGPNASLLWSDCIGRHAGYDAVGGNSLYLGHAAGQYAGKGGDASAAVFIGYQAGRNANQVTPTNSYMSVILGRETACNAKSFPMATMIGINHNEIEELTKSWLETYKPILLIFFYISLVTIAIQFKNENFNLMEAMQHFMAGFFLVFSFFKLLNLKGFAESYQMYDVIAKQVPVWGELLPSWVMPITACFPFVVKTPDVLGKERTRHGRKVTNCW